MHATKNTLSDNARKAAFSSLAFASFVAAWGSGQVAAQSTAPELEAGRASQVVVTSEIKWAPLNPARGDASPKAGALWGDRTGPGASGFLVMFVKGFSSPPHIHNVTYRGVVISGLIHNDDPKAKDMWLPKGSFWTQPAGEAHITAAKGRNNMAYIEIEKGPYLVRPANEAFDNGERPVNVEQSNLVWLDASDITWVDRPRKAASPDGVKMAFLWGKPQDGRLNGTLVKLPTGFTGELRCNGSTLRAVVVQGQPTHHVSGETGVKKLEPGSYFGSSGKAAHQISCGAGEDCIIYVRMEGKFNVIPAQRTAQ